MNEKILFFDAGPVITLVMARLAWILPELKKRFGGKFYITPAVKYELVDRPLTVRRFEFEALEVMKMIRDGIFEMYEKVPNTKVSVLKKLANSAFTMQNRTMDVLQAGEVESVASALQEKNAGVVMDERTLRLLIESNKDMKSLLERRFKKDVSVNLTKMNEFSQNFKNVPIIRSIELVSVAYNLGLLDSYLPKRRDAKSTLLDAVLWATKFNGCAVTEHEIEEIKQFLLK
ncbi:hypothetical protein COV17_00455 [Candidatus Woesearchaeota archaeon CG10_big_fil_rev_8_21_14_0_10_36_11]|nr:MAG: hypothetical protein COV17_00455 [Candidatus Woesearchaeota archaeon CG10_big_fil_rev_8_21_14_0_10_36_11]